MMFAVFLIGFKYIYVFLFSALLFFCFTFCLQYLNADCFILCHVSLMA